MSSDQAFALALMTFALSLIAWQLSRILARLDYLIRRLEDRRSGGGSVMTKTILSLLFIAGILGCSEKTVRNRRDRALNMLRPFLGVPVGND